MSTIGATLNGKHVIDARLTIPAWGASYHDVTLDSEETFTGAVTLVVADLTIACSVLSGGPAYGRSTYRLVAGAGGWGTPLPSKSYANDAGVKVSTALGDAASECGETLDTTALPTTAIGPGFVRPAEIGARLLEQLAPGAWYIGEDGKTRLGARASSTLSSKATIVEADIARGTATIASESIAGILPGVTVTGSTESGTWSMTAVDVEHTLSAEGGLRSKVWAKQGTGGSRRLAAWRALTDQLDPNRAFRAVYEYRVVTLTGNRLNLQPVRVSTGMPTLQRVPIWPGVGGAKISPALGSSVLVGFIDADPGRPYVAAFVDADSQGFVPTTVALAGGGPPVARQGDTVVVYFPSPLAFVGAIGGMPATGNLTATSPAYGAIQTGSAKVTSG